MSPNDHERLEQTWLGKLAKLNPAPGRGACRGVAPHKPLLVFALIDMAEAGLLPDRFFMRSPELVLRFRSYGSIVSERWPTRLDLRMPFYHLSTQHLWEAFTTDRRRATSPEDCAVGEIDPEFFGLLSEPEFCRKARLLLMTRYFEPAEHLAFCESLGFTPTEELQRQSRQLLGAALQSAKRKGRSARFAVQVVTQYRFTCALTGYRCITTEGGSIVDAAHIEAWAQTQNDALTNGLALSKNAHWMFDEGLWSADENFRIVINKGRFSEAGPDAPLLASLTGRPLKFDSAAKLRPDPAMLVRHRRYYGV